MEEQKIKEIFEALKNEALTERERFVMRSQLELLMKDHPLKTPFYIRTAEYMHRLDTSVFSFVGQHAVSMAAFVLIIFGGIGTTFAAGGALPGDALYAVKININEKFEGALAVSDVAKVELSKKITERRLEEAEVLAAQGNLNDENGGAIAAQLAASTDNFEKHVAVLAKKSDEDSSDAESDFDASLSAHARVLAMLGNRAHDANVKTAIEPILSTVRARANKAAKVAAEPALMAAVAVDTVEREDAGDFEKKLSSKKKKLAERLNEVQKLANKEKKKISASTFVRAQGASSTVTFSVSSTTVSEEDMSKVLHDLSDAMREAEETRVGIRIQVNLHDAGALNIDITGDDREGKDADEQDESDKKGVGDVPLNILR